MKKWEYHHIHIHANAMLESDNINKLGSQGWELVGILSILGGNIYYFKREKVEISDPMDAD